MTQKRLKILEVDGRQALVSGWAPPIADMWVDVDMLVQYGVKRRDIKVGAEFPWGEEER